MQWNYAFDLGADTIRMVIRGLDGKYTEAAREAYRRGETVPFAAGDRALEFESRKTDEMVIKRCTKGGLPLSNAAAARWVRRIVAVHEKRITGKRTVLIATSPFAEDDERGAFLRALINEGFEAAGAVDSDFAALTGAEVDAFGYETATVVDMGASAITCSCISNGIRIKADKLTYGMDRANDLIEKSIMSETNMLAGMEAIREIKHGISETADARISIPVLNPERRLPEMCQIPRGLVENVLSGIIDETAVLIEGTICNLPAGCAKDVLKNGIIITGGGSLVLGVGKQLKNRLALPVKTAPDGDSCVINGLKTILEDQNKYSMLINDWRDTGMKA